ncbi:methionyl-tRNA formyltransferase [Magnetospirillum sp. SS-4]|uniref:methionyl-tRNA formyltransferase n=1 Tax=Magnetospirillum sp. SS-4 TaxID=2681465 RepID=UPI001383214D|nr:formyltransferase family protein [Magnetospirillum sp. SS-4]CAA7617696.1 putative formyl transferase [Magnetospirillum sp. SS-4]
MRVALLGRTRALLEAGRCLIAAGHDIPLVWTCRAEPFYDTREEDFEAFAGLIGADFVNALDIHSGESLDRIRDARCEAAISMNWLTLLRPLLLDLFPQGVWNAHAGDLPRYRGNACPNWAILEGESHVGLCIHRMVAALDAGPVLVRDRLPLTDATYISDVYDWMGVRIPQMFLEAIDGLERGTATPVPQPDDSGQALRVYPRRPEDGRIDWRWPADHVLRLIRASSRPFDGAFTSLEGMRKVTIWRAERAGHPGPFRAVPGQVCFCLDGDPVIACGDGVIKLTDVGMDGLGGTEDAKAVIARSLRNRLLY